jgi:hypothetical protein
MCVRARVFVRARVCVTECTRACVRQLERSEGAHTGRVDVHRHDAIYTFGGWDNAWDYHRDTIVYEMR